MKHFKFLPILSCFVLLFVAFSSCAEERMSSVLFQGMDEYRVLSTISREESPDSVSLSKSKAVLYSLDVPINIPKGHSLEISYTFSLPDENSSEENQIILADGENSFDIEISFNENQDTWILPITPSSMGMKYETDLPNIISYALPLSLDS
jgi:hypothetical protein